MVSPAPARVWWWRGRRATASGRFRRDGLVVVCGLAGAGALGAVGVQVYRRDFLWRAWAAVRGNDGAPGIDGTTLADVEEYGVDRLLVELAEDLRNGQWRPLPARRVFIPKPGTTEQRPLSIPSVRDRIVQAALKIVLEPIFEADFLP